MNVISCFALLLSLQSSVVITTRDNKQFRGEVIGRYENRWFWETGGERHLAIFERQSGQPRIRLLAQKDILAKRPSVSDGLPYREFLKREGIFFEGSPTEGESLITTANDGHHLHEAMYGNFAWDLSYQVDGKDYEGDGTALNEYYSFGKKVFANIRGRVVEMRNNWPDNPPDPTLTGQLSVTNGNYVLLNVGGPFYAVYLHLKQGSIPAGIKKGVWLEPGDLIGEIGNSGLSYTPHLHMSLYYWLPEQKRFLSVPAEWLINKKFIEPRRGDIIKSSQHLHQQSHKKAQ